MPSDIKQYNEAGDADGYWEIYYSNGQLDFKGTYINGLRHGLWETYLFNGELYFKGRYEIGKPVGYWVYFYCKIFYAD